MTHAEVHPTALSGGKSGEYLGIETSLSFSTPTQELEILQSGCAVFDLNWRALINVAGKDRVRWLHNMVTNNVRDLPPNHGAYNFVLNAQGRILGDLYVFNRGESLILETDRSRLEALLPALRRFIIMDKVELADAGGSMAAIGLAGPKSADTLAAARLDVAGMEPLEIQDRTVGDGQVQVIRGAEQKPHWFEVWSDPSQLSAISKLLIEAGAKPVGSEALEMWRVLRGIPQYAKDIRDRDLPQETGQTQALNFTKGCYIGQEIVERIRSRGQVHRKFTGFEFENGLPQPGKFDSVGRTFAEVTSVARVPSTPGERKIGLGYVRVDSVPQDGVLDLNGIKAKTVNLPFESSSI